MYTQTHLKIRKALCSVCSITADTEESETCTVERKEEEESELLPGKTPTAPPEEEIDIDLDDPEVEKAATTIQATFRRRLSSKMSQSQIGPSRPALMTKRTSRALPVMRLDSSDDVTSSSKATQAKTATGQLKKETISNFGKAEHCISFKLE